MSDYYHGSVSGLAARLVWALDDCAGEGFSGECRSFVSGMEPENALAILLELFPGTRWTDFAEHGGEWTVDDDGNDLSAEFGLRYDEENGVLDVRCSAHFERNYDFLHRFVGVCVMHGGIPYVKRED